MFEPVDELYKKITYIENKIKNKNNDQNFFMNHMKKLTKIFESIKTLKNELADCKSQLNQPSIQSALPPQNQNPSIECCKENEALKQVIIEANKKM